MLRTTISIQGALFSDVDVELKEGGQLVLVGCTSKPEGIDVSKHYVTKDRREGSRPKLFGAPVGTS